MRITSSPAVITDNLLLLGPMEYPIYLVRSGQDALVFEGGVGACGPLVEEHLARFDVRRDSVRQIVVTHGHPDHVMSVPAFRRLFPQARVLASVQAAAVMANEKALKFFSKMDGTLTQWLLKKGAIHEQHRPQALAELKMPVDVLLKEGDTVSVGGLRFNVLATPGHSDCHLSFYEPTSKLLIASDATGFYMPQLGEAWWPNYFVDYGQYMNSIRRLAALDAEVLCLGHNAVITGAAAIRSYFSGVTAATEAYHTRILEAVKGGTSVTQLAEQLGAEAHAQEDRLALDFFQKSCLSLIKHSLRFAGIEAA
jgi:glyoxylase-like metal-dependent hydrolase (beta-lactamase superfamily II)